VAAGRHTLTLMSDEADTRAWLDWARIRSLIQWVCACTWLCRVEAGEGGGFASMAVIWSDLCCTSKLRSHAQMTPSRPPE